MALTPAWVPPAPPIPALETKAITLRPVEDKPGYHKLMDLPDAFPLLPGTAPGHRSGGGVALLQVPCEGPNGGPRDAHTGGLRPNESPAEAGGRVAIPVPAKEGRFWKTAIAAAARCAGWIRTDVPDVWNGLAGSCKAMLDLPGPGIRSLPDPFGHLCL